MYENQRELKMSACGLRVPVTTAENIEKYSSEARSCFYRDSVSMQQMQMRSNLRGLSSPSQQNEGILLLTNFQGPNTFITFNPVFWWTVNCVLFIGIWRSQFRGKKSELAMKTWSEEKLSMWKNVTDFECPGNETYFNISGDPYSCLIFNWFLLYRQVRDLFQFTCQLFSLFMRTNRVVEVTHFPDCSFIK